MWLPRLMRPINEEREHRVATGLSNHATQNFFGILVTSLKHRFVYRISSTHLYSHRFLWIVNFHILRIDTWHRNSPSLPLPVSLFAHAAYSRSGVHSSSNFFRFSESSFYNALLEACTPSLPTYNEAIKEPVFASPAYSAIVTHSSTTPLLIFLSHVVETITFVEVHHTGEPASEIEQAGEDKSSDE
ncbi:Serine/threonine-protein kinase [Dirofilaria immitis]